MTDWRSLSGPLAAQASGDGPRIVLCHGFTQTSMSWRPIATQLVAAGFGTVIVDLPGHGGSATVLADLPTAADLLVETCGAATYVGYSMGGRACLHAALRHPDSVNRLALIGADPGIEDDEARAARRTADEARAERLRAVGVPVFLRDWMAQSLFGDGPPDAADIADLADRSRNTVEGLGSSLRLAGTGAQAPLWDQLPELTMPVVMMAGERDAKFLAIARRVADAVPGATLVPIADADHAAHLQQPIAVVAALVALMARPIRD